MSATLYTVNSSGFFLTRPFIDGKVIQAEDHHGYSGKRKVETWSLIPNSAAIKRKKVHTDLPGGNFGATLSGKFQNRRP